MTEIVSVVLDRAEGYATQAVNFQDALCVFGGGGVGRGGGWRCADVYVAFFAGADAGAGAVEGVAFEVGVEG